MVRCRIAALLAAYAGIDMAMRLYAEMLLVTITWLWIDGTGTSAPGSSGAPNPPSKAFLFPASSSSRNAMMVKNAPVTFTFIVLVMSSMIAWPANIFARTSDSGRVGFQPEAGPPMPPFARRRLM